MQYVAYILSKSLYVYMIKVVVYMVYSIKIFIFIHDQSFTMMLRDKKEWYLYININFSIFECVW